MPTPSGRTTPSWSDVVVPRYTPLRASQRVQCCVIGAGITGLTTAYELLRRGRQVVVIDDNEVGGGESGRTTAHLSFALDDRFHALEQTHGAEGARQAAESHRWAVDRIEQIARDEKIQCDFERLPGYLFAAEGQDASELPRELEAAHRAGLSDVELLDNAPIHGFASGSCLRFPNQGQFHILKYLAGLARAIQLRGGQIYTGTRVRSVSGGSPARLETEDSLTIEADAIVVATNSPISDWVAMHTKLYPYRTYAIAVRVPHGSVPPALFWDLDDPYHYVRLQHVAETKGEAAHDLLIVGGEDHKVGQADDEHERFQRLDDWARRYWPQAGALAFRWSGQVIEPVDGLAYIGRDPANPENVYIATGDSGHGMTHGTIAADLITGLIVDGEHRWAEVYDPARKSLRTLKTYLQENINVAAQYTSWVTGGEVSSEDQIPPDSGAVLRTGFTKVAVYRDPAGQLTRLTAVCPHLQCIVDWNPVEKSWDCPCHGSRFGPTGDLLNGPANRGLEPSETGEIESTESSSRA